MKPTRDIDTVRERLLNEGESTGRAGTAPGSGSVNRAVRELHGPRSDFVKWQLGRFAKDEFLGSGSIVQPLLDDPRVSDVLINGDGNIWVDRGAGLVRIPDHVDQPRNLATRLAAVAGQRLDDAAPIAEGRLPDGTRMHAILAPLSHEGATISLRAFRRQAFTLDELVERDLTGPDGAAVLEGLLRSRANVLISGATGSGKTTLASALLSLVPANERIICIEEAAELAPDHPHTVHLQVRRDNVEGSGGIGLDALVRTAMRMRPDRLVLGECRGAEVREVLSALNTGHEGGMATIHANTAEDVPARLCALGALAGMEPRFVAVQAKSALDAIVHIRRDDKRRQIEQIAVFDTASEGSFTATLAMSRTSQGDLAPAKAWPALARRLDTEIGTARA